MALAKFETLALNRTGTGAVFPVMLQGAGNCRKPSKSVGRSESTEYHFQRGRLCFHLHKIGEGSNDMRVVLAKKITKHFIVALLLCMCVAAEIENKFS